MRRLIIDIETSPNLAHVWDLWNQNIGLNQLLESGEVICFAAKWYGDSSVSFWSEYHDGKEQMIDSAWGLLDEADAVIHYNGRHFDVPRLNAEFLRRSWPPPSPFKQIDLYQTVKRRFDFPSGKLAYIADALGIGAKIVHEGHTLWIKCMAGDPDAWAQMREYNIKDVELLEPLHDLLRPWIVAYPSMAALEGDNRCPACGSEELNRQGFAYTRTGRYQRFVCEVCGKWSRATNRDNGTKITEVTE